MTENQIYTMVQDQLRTMFRLESTYSLCYVVTKQGSTIDLECKGEWREKICMWCYQLVDHYHYDREVVSIAMDYLDRYLSLQQQEQIKSDHVCQRSQKFTPIQNYQLTAMTCLYIAIKLHAEYEVESSSQSLFLSNHLKSQCNYVEPNRKEVLRIQSYVTFSGGQFIENDILEMEEEILMKLKWKVNPVTPSSFVSYMMKIIFPVGTIKQQEKINEVLDVLLDLSTYLTEIAICLPSITETVKTFSEKDGFISTKRAYSPSSIAYASILASMDLITVEAFPLKMRHGFIENISKIAFEALSFPHHQDFFFFNPFGKEIRELKNILQKTSQLNEFLHSAVDVGEKTPQNPILVAKMAGFLNLNIGKTRRDDVQKNTRPYNTPRNYTANTNQRNNGRSPICVSSVEKDVFHSKKRSRFQKKK